MIYLFGAGTQTYALSHEANSLNFALSYIRKDSIVLGFKVVKGSLARYMSHVKLDGCYFTLCLVKEDKSVHRWESSASARAERKLIKAGYTWLVCLCGSDDHVGYTRFKSLDDAKKWFVSSDTYINYDDDMYWKVN